MTESEIIAWVEGKAASGWTWEYLMSVGASVKHIPEIDLQRIAWALGFRPGHSMSDRYPVSDIPQSVPMLYTDLVNLIRAQINAGSREATVYTNLVMNPGAYPRTDDFQYKQAARFLGLQWQFSGTPGTAAPAPVAPPAGYAPARPPIINAAGLYLSPKTGTDFDGDGYSDFANLFDWQIQDLIRQKLAAQPSIKLVQLWNYMVGDKAAPPAMVDAALNALGFTATQNDIVGSWPFGRVPTLAEGREIVWQEIVNSSNDTNQDYRWIVGTWLVGKQFNLKLADAKLIADSLGLVAPATPVYAQIDDYALVQLVRQAIESWPGATYAQMRDGILTANPGVSGEQFDAVAASLGYVGWAPAPGAAPSAAPAPLAPENNEVAEQIRAYYLAYPDVSYETMRERFWTDGHVPYLQFDGVAQAIGLTPMQWHAPPPPSVPLIFPTPAQESQYAHSDAFVTAAISTAFETYSTYEYAVVRDRFAQDDIPSEQFDRCATALGLTPNRWGSSIPIDWTQVPGPAQGPAAWEPDPPEPPTPGPATYSDDEVARGISDYHFAYPGVSFAEFRSRVPVVFPGISLAQFDRVAATMDFGGSRAVDWFPSWMHGVPDYPDGHVTPAPPPPAPAPAPTSALAKLAMVATLFSLMK